MREAELIVVSDTGACTIYTIQFLKNADSEFERFYEKFKGRLEYDEEFERLLNVIGRIAEFGALERYFRPEGRMRDRVCALPVLKSRLRIYCLRLSDKILILGNGGAKKTRTYDEDHKDTTKGHAGRHVRGDTAGGHDGVRDLQQNQRPHGHERAKQERICAGVGQTSERDNQVAERATQLHCTHVVNAVRVFRRTPHNSVLSQSLQEFR